MYSATWIYYITGEPKAELGVGFERSERAGTLRITEVVPASPADRAGMRKGDVIIAVNGRSLRNMAPFYDFVDRGGPGDRVAFTVERPGAATPLTLTVTLAAHRHTPRNMTPAQAAAFQLVNHYPVLFAVVGLVVLFLRLDNPNAWLLAVLFAGYIAWAPLFFLEPYIPPPLRRFMLAYMIAFRILLPAVLFYFFAVFPASSPIDRRVPRLKSVLLTAAAVVAISFALALAWDGTSHPLSLLDEQLHGPAMAIFLEAYFLGVNLLGLVSLIWNHLRAPSTEVRRKTQVMVWGTVAALLPFIVVEVVSEIVHKPYWQFPFWSWVPAVIGLFLMPLSFAYAVVKHRVMGIPVLLKKSARYLLVQRGFIVLLFAAAALAIALFTRTFSRLFSADSNLGMTISAVFGIVLVWVSAPMVRRGTERIDRAFFRSAYDARVILQDLAEKARIVTGQHELASLLEKHIRHALQPETFACYLEGPDGQFHSAGSSILPTLRPVLPLLADVTQYGRSWNVPANETAEALGVLSLLSPECLVPILGRDSRLLGLLVLGLRRSGESYSEEDKRLLDSVASQAGVALGSILLAEKMAERLEAERRAAHEMEIARQVQSKLFPQKNPPLRTLAYAGDCIQARAVGGDYYDFLDLGPGAVGFVLADIAGKGISAALLMANLQANLRSQYAIALEDPARLLQSVNRLFYESTEPSNYATLFFGIYHDDTRVLRYANCGHNPPLLLRSNGAVQRLTGTATVLGLFDKWECELNEVQFVPDDVLVIYTDGITEAWNDHDEEFGEARLLQTLKQDGERRPPVLLHKIISAVQQFSRGQQSDDLTLVVASAIGG